MGNSNHKLILQIHESINKKKYNIETVKTLFNDKDISKHGSLTTVQLELFLNELFEYTYRTVTPQEISSRLVPVQTGSSITLVRKSCAVLPPAPLNTKQVFVTSLMQQFASMSHVQFSDFVTCSQSIISHHQVAASSLNAQAT
jgi:hypothetical protein